MPNRQDKHECIEIYVQKPSNGEKTMAEQILHYKLVDIQYIADYNTLSSVSAAQGSSRLLLNFMDVRADCARAKLYG